MLSHDSPRERPCCSGQDNSSTVLLVGEAECGNHDKFNLGRHINETQFDNRGFDFKEKLVSKYIKQKQVAMVNKSALNDV